MPTYVYGCDACGHQFEKFQKFSDEPVRVCPACGATTRRIFQPAGIVFKGSGWHVTDYKRSGGNANGSNGAAQKEDGVAPKETTAESKSEKISDSASTTTDASSK